MVSESLLKVHLFFYAKVLSLAFIESAFIIQESPDMLLLFSRIEGVLHKHKVGQFAYLSVSGRF